MAKTKEVGVMADAKAAIERVFSDRSVTQGETKARLTSLRDEIDMMIDTLYE